MERMRRTVPTAWSDAERIERTLEAFFDCHSYRSSVDTQLGMVAVEYDDFLPCSMVRPLLEPLVAPYSLHLVRRYTDEALAGQLFALCELHELRVRRKDGSTGHFDIIKRELRRSLQEVSLDSSAHAYLLRRMSDLQKSGGL